MRVLFLVMWSLLMGCTNPAPSGTNSLRSVEERAVTDALQRFIRHTGVKELALQPHKRLSSDAGAVAGATIEIVSRHELLKRHEDEEVAPLISAINVYRVESEPSNQFHVAVNRFPVAHVGFERVPYGMGIDFTYQIHDDSVDMVAKAVEVE